MAGPNIPYTELSSDQVLTQSFDESQDRLRVDAEVTAVLGVVEVVITDTNDSIKIGNGAGVFANVDASRNLTVRDADANTTLESIDTQLSSGITVNSVQSGAWTAGRTWVLDDSTDSVTAIQGTSPWIISGAVSATQSGTWNIGTLSTITNVVHVDDNGASLTVDGTVTALQGTSPWVVSGTVITSPNVNIHDGSGTSISSTGSSLNVDITNTVPVSQSGTWNITNVSGTISLPTGASTSALQTTGNTSLSSIDSKLFSTNTISDSITGSTSEVIINTLGYNTIKVHMGTNITFGAPLDDVIYFDATIDDVTWFPANGKAISIAGYIPLSAAEVADVFTFNVSSINKFRISAASPPPVGTTDFTAILDSKESVLDGIIGNINVNLPSGAATDATLSVINNKIPSGLTVSFSRLLTNVTGDVSISSSVLPDGAATESTLNLINSKFVNGNDIGDVTINNASGASAVNIQDGGNSITVDGTITANAGTNLNTSLLSLEATQADIRTSVQLIDDAIYTDGSGTPTKAIAVAGTDGTNPQIIKTDAAGELQIDVLTLPNVVIGSGTVTTVSTVTSLTQLNGAAISMNTGVRDAGTQRVTIATNDVVPITDNSSSLTVDAPVATPVFVRLSDGSAAISTLPVSVAAAATSIAKAEDVLAADGDVGVPALAVRKATPANTSGTDGDYEFLQMSAGRLWTSATIDTALPAGTALIGKVGIDQTTPGTTNAVAIAQLGANTIATGNGTSSTGVQRVALISDPTANTVAYNVNTNSLGRTELRYYAVAAASGTTTTETAITLTRSAGTGATSTGTSFVVTSGKKFRITSFSVATRGNTTATIQTTTFNLRINTAGAVVTTSTPIILAQRSATAAISFDWDRTVILNPDGGIEIPGDGTLQWGITAAATFTTNAPTWDVTITGYEY